MEIFGALALLFLVKFIYGIRKTNKDEKDRLSRLELDPDPNKNLYDNTVEGMSEEKKIGTRELFMETLTKIGCQYELADEEDDNRIFFAYQGEHFFADTTDEGWYVHLWDTHWGQIELYDVEELARLKKAVNEANLNCATITVYTIDDVAKTVNVHCKSTFPFIAQIPNLENYLRSELNDFFRAHQYVGNEMSKLREQEEKVKS